MEQEQPADVLRQVLDPADRRLRLALDSARARLEHSASKGSLLESELRKILRDHLPRSFDVGQGEVVDSLGSRTGQIDLLITNEHQPFRWGTDEPGVHIIEGISAGGELKAQLGTAELSDALAKGSRFKRLRYRSHVGATVYGRHESDLSRFYDSPPFLVVAVESSIAVQTLLNRLADAPSVPSPDSVGPVQDPVDAVFLLDRGVALNLGDGLGQLSFRLADGSVISGWVFYESSTVVAEMMIWLHRVMPRYSMASGSPINNYGPSEMPVTFVQPTPKAQRD